MLFEACDIEEICDSLPDDVKNELIGRSFIITGGGDSLGFIS